MHRYIGVRKKNYDVIHLLSGKNLLSGTSELSDLSVRLAHKSLSSHDLQVFSN